MLVTLSLALGLAASTGSLDAPAQHGAAQVTARTTASDESPLPPAMVQLERRVGAKTFAKLIEHGDAFIDQLSRVVSSWDKRGVSLDPRRVPKILNKRLVAFFEAYVKATDAEVNEATEGMLALCEWRLTGEQQRQSAELARAKRGLGVIKTVLANLRARSVDPEGRFPVRLAYLRVGENGDLVDARETLEDAKALSAGMKRVEADIPRLLDYAQQRVDAQNRNRRALEVLGGTFGALVANVSTPAE
jgi:hypothetical protein